MQISRHSDYNTPPPFHHPSINVWTHLQRSNTSQTHTIPTYFPATTWKISNPLFNIFINWKIEQCSIITLLWKVISDSDYFSSDELFFFFFKLKKHNILRGEARIANTASFTFIFSMTQNTRARAQISQQNNGFSSIPARFIVINHRKIKNIYNIS